MKKIINADILSKLFNANNNDFACLIEEKLKRDKIDLSFSYANNDEIKVYIKNYLELLKSNKINRSFEENHNVWNNGWQENLNIVKKEGLIKDHFRPRYFRKSKFLRFNKDIIVSDNLYLEYHVFDIVRKYIFKTYLTQVNSIYELGCGSCQNLWELLHLFPDKKIHGFDWAIPSIKLIDEMSKKYKNITGSILNFLNPPTKITLNSNSAFLSIHAFEQIGDQHDKLINMILASKPSIVVNYEPIYEFYDENNIYDYLAIWYSEKRNYLNKYWTAIKNLEKENKVKIIDSYRPKVGGVFHEASLIVWKPL